MYFFKIGKTMFGLVEQKMLNVNEMMQGNGQRRRQKRERERDRE